ncbi:hypothetical protein D9757_000360 [Collybiopsis confluens]|uniref:Condensation domain-containing protein n=1 Tax=Collybiopsis confluens TaxID=2823264 RepID=A0A8H5I203_9AGAR|nr:hypothetical protein D9757_000360 [Collybiopsis confluens]
MSIGEWTRRLDGAYERPLGLNETGFFWDTVYRGTADTLQHAIVEEVAAGTPPSAIQNEANVQAAWIALKEQYPLLGVRIEERARSPSSQAEVQTTDNEIYFIIDPSRLSSLDPREVVFLTCSSREEALILEDGISNEFRWRDVQEWQRTVGNLDINMNVVEAEDDANTNGRILSNSLPACLFFIKRLDSPSTFHVMIHVAHLITDGIANSSILSGFLDLLSRKGNISSVSMEKDALEERLRLGVAAEALYPDLKPGYSRARKRWNRVLGKVLLGLRTAKMNGGHSLPRIIRPSTSYTPAKSSHISFGFTPAQTLAILRSCKKLGITFGNAHPILGQLGATRLLLRRRLRTLAKGSGISSQEDIGDREWAYRRRQPMHTAGPANLRPYLDPQWYNNGGAGNVCLSISFFFFTLPFMPLGEAGTLADSPMGVTTLADVQMMEVPHFNQLLSRSRFLLRCNMIKKQSAEVFRHPRFLDISMARHPARIERTRTAALVWKNGAVKEAIGDKEDKMIPADEQPQAVGGAVLTHGGSSFGNSDHLVTPYYPRAPTSTLPQSEPTAPAIYLVKSTTRLRCRPTELYLGASTSRGQFHLAVFWDENVYEKSVVQEWLNEVVSATEWFLVADSDADDGIRMGMNSKNRDGDGVVIVAKL